MELPIKITGDNILMDEITITDDKFCYLVLDSKMITKKSYAKIEYTFESGVKHPEEFYHINEDIFLSSELVGIEMCTYLRDSNKSNPHYMRILFNFKGGTQIFMCFENDEECREYFKIVKQYFNYINGL